MENSELKALDEKLAWFRARVQIIRLERQMALMTCGVARIQADPQYLEGVYLKHIQDLMVARSRIAQAQ
jgi:hypothetical protein